MPGIRGGGKILCELVGLATEESMTTTLPVAPTCAGGGSLVVGALSRPVVPLDGRGGWTFLGGSWGLSAIVLVR